MHTPSAQKRRLLGAVATLALGAASVPPLAHLSHPRRAVADSSVVAVAPDRADLPPHPVAREASRGGIRHLPTGAMPVGDLRGWKQVLAQDFTARTLPRGWGRYSGAPGGNRYGWWDPSHVVVRGDDLHLVGDWRQGRFVTGGVMATSLASRYGRYEIRFKVSRAQGVAYALLLWPSTAPWPAGGEIDFAEDGGGRRVATAATLHYGPRNTQVQRSVRADFTRFQTVGVQWTPGRLVYTLNGRPWATVVSPHVPSGPMRLALQLEAGRGTSWSPAPTRATPRTVDLAVDWVVGYRRA